MSKEFSYVLLTGKSLCATQFKSDFEQNNTSKITIGGYSSNQIPYYIIKNTKEYIYPFTSKWFIYHNSRFSSLNSTNILEEFKELRDREYSNILNNSKQIISNAINENYEAQIPSIYTNLDNIFKGQQSVINPENIHVVLEKGKLIVYYEGICKSNSIICEEGEIYIYKRYSDTWSNVVIDNAICKIFNVSSNKLVTVNKLKAEIIDFNSNLIIEQLDCNKPVKIKVSSTNKNYTIQIKNILGDKNNISVEMDTKYTTEDVVNIEGKPYSQWKTKAQTKGKNSTIYPIKGKTFIATGKIIIGQYNTREQIYSLIKAAGGNIAKSKEHYYDYLVTDKHFTHGDNSSSKLEDAERRGIIPISGAQLEEMLRNEGVIQ